MSAFTSPLPRLVSLPGGITLSVEEYGTPGGVPVFFFHGWPSAAVQGRLLDRAARELGIRIIASDRPGCGASTPQARRKLIDWPPLVSQLAAELGLARYRVLGISGGGPYALACAATLPHEVEKAAVVCGAPPLADLGTAVGFNFVYRTMLAAYSRIPGLVRRVFRLLHPMARHDPPEWMMTAMRGALVGPDRDTLADLEIARMCHEGFRRAWGEHRDGVFEDAEIYTHPWGFRLEDIRVPVSVWHGTEDNNFVHTLAEYARRIPGGTLRIVENEGHFSLPIRRAPEILGDLIATPARDLPTAR